MKRKYLLLALIGVFALSMALLAGCGDNEADKEKQKEEQKQEQSAEWYKSVLKDESVTKDYPYYRLIDIDQDGTDELFLSSTEKAFVGADDKAKLMADVDGKATDLKKIGGAGGESFSYDESDKTLFYYSRLSGEEHIVQYKLEKGKLVELKSSDKYEEGHDPNNGNNTDDTYYIDGKEVKEADAEALWDQFDDKAAAVTYSKDGKGSTATDNDADGDDANDNDANDADDNDDADGND